MNGHSTAKSIAFGACAHALRHGDDSAHGSRAEVEQPVRHSIVHCTGLSSVPWFAQLKAAAGAAHMASAQASQSLRRASHGSQQAAHTVQLVSACSSSLAVQTFGAVEQRSATQASHAPALRSAQQASHAVQSRVSGAAQATAVAEELESASAAAAPSAHQHAVPLLLRLCSRAPGAVLI